MGFLTRYYEARCGWMTVAVGCQLGSQLGYPGHLANPPDMAARRRPSRPRRCRRPSRDRGSATAAGHTRWRWFRAQRPACTYVGPMGSGAPPAARPHGDLGRAGQAVHAHQVTEKIAGPRIGRGVLTAIRQLCRTSRRSWRP